MLLQSFINYKKLAFSFERNKVIRKNNQRRFEGDN